MDLKVTCLSPDISKVNSQQIQELIESNNSSDVIVFPEYILEICDYKPTRFNSQLVVFGSRIVDGYNRLYLSCGDSIQTYNKRRMTPWEEHLNHGEESCIFEFKGVRCAVMTCFDVEFPELVVDLKKSGVELLIVPSATETEVGYHRVSRCASARSVELSCAVVTCHLVGRCDNELIDRNVGANNLFLPAQSLFSETQGGFKEPKRNGDQIDSFVVRIGKIREQKNFKKETNPGLVYA